MNLPRRPARWALLLACGLAAWTGPGCTLYRKKAAAPDPPPLTAAAAPRPETPNPAAPPPQTAKGERNGARPTVAPNRAHPGPAPSKAAPAAPAVAALEPPHPPPAPAPTPRVPPPGPEPEPGSPFFEPGRPCLTWADTRGIRQVLFGGRPRLDGNRWLAALNRVFSELKVDCGDKDFLVLVLSAIQQESGVQVDPPLETRELDKLLEFRLNALGDRNPVMRGALDATGIEEALRAKLRKDQTRGDIRTEGELARYVDGELRPWMRGHLGARFALPDALADIAADAGLPNPVNTLGPLQVNVGKAFRNARARGDPVASPEAMRARLLNPATAMVDGLREGVYLLWQPYRFYRRHLEAELAVYFAGVDYNAGEFSSRNAAFQEQAARLSGRGLTLDGDLLLYREGKPQLLVSLTERAVRSALPGRETALIRADLLREKTAGFSRTATARGMCRAFHRVTREVCKVAQLPAGAANRTAGIKLGRDYTPANYGGAVLGRFRENRAAFAE